MLSIYIVDDEPIITRGVSRMIQSFGLELKVIGSATDGQKALDDILRLQPDILITDVEMPGRTGLDIISKVTESGQLTRIIFLSGYRDFSYIKHAMQHNAVDYLLKPVNPNEMRKALIKAIQSFDRNRKLAYFDEAQKHHNPNSASMQINTLGEAALSEIMERLTSQELDATNLSYACICVGIPYNIQTKGHSLPFEHFELLRFTSLNQIKKHFESQGSIPLKQASDSFDCLFPLKTPNNYNMLLAEIQKLEKTMFERNHIKVLFGISEINNDLQRLAHSLDSAKRQKEMFFFNECTINYECADINPKSAASSEQMLSLFESLQKDLISGFPINDSQISKFVDSICDYHPENIQSILNTASMMLGQLRNNIKDYQIQIDTENHYNAYVKKIQEAQSCQALKNILLEYFQHLMEFRDSGNGSINSIIAKAKYYMDEHYKEDISLDSLAQYVNMNASYFSFYFKKNTGEKYKTYLTRLRLEKSLPLLANGELKIYQIANDVGYKNVKRYTEAFRKQYGCLPVEYRKKS